MYFDIFLPSQSSRNERNCHKRKHVNSLYVQNLKCVRNLDFHSQILSQNLHLAKYHEHMGWHDITICQQYCMYDIVYFKNYNFLSSTHFD